MEEKKNRKFSLLLAKRNQMQITSISLAIGFSVVLSAEYLRSFITTHRKLLVDCYYDVLHLYIGYLGSMHSKKMLN